MCMGFVCMRNMHLHSRLNWFLANEHQGINITFKMSDNYYVKLAGITYFRVHMYTDQCISFICGTPISRVYKCRLFVYIPVLVCDC